MKLNVSRARRGESLPMTCPCRVNLLTSDESGPGEESAPPKVVE